MKEQVRTILKSLHAEAPARGLYFRARALAHWFLRGPLRRGAILRRFYARPERLVHLGCGERMLPGWLNVDLYTGDLYGDLTEPLPFRNSTAQYVYSHHVIEHVEREQAVRLLQEVYRILTPGGKVRLVTPDLAALVRTYTHPEESADLIAFYCQDTPLTHPAEFFNLEMRQGGEHRFIYDFDLLRHLLEASGFRNVTREEYGASGTPAFDGLDFHNYEMIDRISLAVEAEKPERA